MNYVGIDLHQTSSRVCILTEDGELIERRIKTDRESFDKLFAGVPPARILVEASTESEWCARIAQRRGKSTAVVALARKLAGIMFAVWRDGTEFDPLLLRPGGPPVAPAA